ncbi:flavin reductase [Poseidonocella sp. HB161398]|uniref:flavin reductase n=1 Tax=Poseidonocella sp. HB161398 TaxID=2320855 RepID=UPI0011082729|nr:flavin reductase [Poseidonocella sp. HB161398]
MDRPAPDAAGFRAAMSRLGAAVNIVTTDGPAGRHGITASAVCSVTDAPPTLLVCVNHRSSAHDVILANGALCVNVLAEGHVGLAMRFGRPGLDPAERFAAASWQALATGAPALDGAAVALDCRISGTRRIGTHSVIFAAVAEIRLAGAASGLVYFDRNFHSLGPDAARKDLT